MAECERCGDFTDNAADGRYHYCDDCLEHFTTVESEGVVVEEDPTADEYHIIVTARDASMDGGSEQSHVEALARGKYIADETGLPALFKYETTGSRWDLETYLQEHPSVRTDVHDRLRRVPEGTDEGFLGKVRRFL
ncbi:hypothetical protein SAMN05192561_11728 [Halopenitus malekzadehii]|uniref:Uncharacterized protein n=1 Tax=Halopenitus malekzadehii TaxID=1267564 RepID=A0A1H6JNY6_9EURY|nr:hypothetical protein [Halopenitus malekzadehii]SEH63810.1 hypothetical protein SAMN05192561_11728 [Halopenitus malekzadehii]